MTESDALFDVGLYAQDCFAFAKQFLEVSGLQARGPRRVPAALRATQQVSLEERSGLHLCSFCMSRNRNVIKRSFFSERFKEDYLQQVRACGIRLACEKPIILRPGARFQCVAI